MEEAVIGIILEDSCTKVLAIKRQDAPIWVLPGGGIEKWESPEEAVTREVLEETGLIVTVNRKCAEYYPVNRFAAKTHVFECQRVGGTLQSGAEASAVGFFSKESLPNPFFPLHRDWLFDAENNPHQLVSKQITQVSLTAILKYFFFHPLIVLKFLWSKWIKNSGC